MGTKLKNYSYSITMKVIAFMVLILCFTGAITAVVKTSVVNDGQFRIVAEDNYFVSRSYIRETEDIVRDLTKLIGEFKNEEQILKGGALTESEVKRAEDELFSDFRYNSANYNPKLSKQENYTKFKEIYADKLAQARERLIKNEVKEYKQIVQRLKEYENEGLIYYASDGINVFASAQLEREQFKSYPSYLLFEEYKQEIYPAEIKNNKNLYQITEKIERLDPGSNVIYIALTDKFLNPRIETWQQNKIVVANSAYYLVAFLLGCILSFAYLVFVIGRKSAEDRQVYLSAVDRLYTDVVLGLCLGLMVLWIGLMMIVDFRSSYGMIILVTLPIAAMGFILILSLVKQFKNGTVVKHTLIYAILYKLFNFVRNVYGSGSIGIKIVVLVIGYPLVVASTFFMFPVTIGLAAWFAFKRVKEFTAIKDGVAKIKTGDIHHVIDVNGNGELGELAANINGITEGLKKAVDNELKSERLKTELITNVSHDIRTPLTSIITYIDLLKKEKDPAKRDDYIEILDQKSQRLKILTDDLFEAAKASSGTIPVNLERIDLVALITQGLGELNDKIEELDLEFKVNHPKGSLYIAADGKLLWRAIENLLSNIFKYALTGSRVYIDVEDVGSEVLLTIKNVSAYELNISAEELMERFKRGDESRSSQGSGLGLSIAKSLIDIQRGRFYIQIDGDLFKALVYIPKYGE